MRSDGKFTPSVVYLGRVYLVNFTLPVAQFWMTAWLKNEYTVHITDSCS